MIPTPGQIEQEYLAKYHGKKGTFFCVNQKNIDLTNNIKSAKKTNGIKRKCDVKKSVENIINLVFNIDHSPFK
jgi:hypothetical protein